MILTTAPSEIIEALLIANGLGSSAENNPLILWPIYISHEPDGKKAQTETITLYDTGGDKDGRYMRTGETIQHESLQVRVRSKIYLSGFNRVNAIAEFFDTILREEIIVDSVNYVIQNISRTSPPLPLGTEKGTKRRQVFTLNIAVTINEEN